MLAEPNTQPINIRETAVEMLFEKFQTPALFLAKSAVLGSFASGRQTSLVVDMGHEASVGSSPCLRALQTSVSCIKHQTLQLTCAKGLKGAQQTEK